MTPSKQCKFFIIAGEPSGDLHAASLIKELKAIIPESLFWGIGGEKMIAAGLNSLQDISGMAVMGFAEVIHKYNFFKQVYNKALNFVKTERPDAVILVDYPGFNLRFAADVHKMGIKTIYYICPQVWAWHQSRIKKMAKIIDLLITIFPFEKNYFQNTGLQTEFVGHPFVDLIKVEKNLPLASIPWEGNIHLALLPGSRRQEVARIAPVLLHASYLLEKKIKGLGIILASPSDKITAYIKEISASFKYLPSRWNIVTGITRQVIRQATAAFVASGTATVETALFHCPMVITYKTSLLSYFLAKLLIKVPYIGMVNIIAEKKVCPELIPVSYTHLTLQTIYYV